MKPVDQRYWDLGTLPVGDCLQACIASIFELDLDEVPHFMERQYLSGNTRPWEHEVMRWAMEFGVSLGWLRYEEPHKEPLGYHPGHWIAKVRSVYGGTPPHSTHAVVMWGNEVVHDPNPISRDYHAFNREPYEFWGESWFEIYHAPTFTSSIDWRVILDALSMDDAA